jgi:hypothetical protein
LRRVTDLPAPLPTPAAEVEGAEPEVEGIKLEHPYDIITRVKIDLEPYVLLLQVRD